MPISLTWKPDDTMRADVRAFLERVKLRPEDAEGLKALILDIASTAFDEGCTLSVRLQAAGLKPPKLADLAPAPAPAENVAVQPVPDDDIPF